MSEDQFRLAAKLVAEALACPEATLTSASALGTHPHWDSISHLNVMMALEQAFDIPIDEVTIQKYETLAAIQTLFAK